MINFVNYNFVNEAVMVMHLVTHLQKSWFHNFCNMVHLIQFTIVVISNCSCFLINNEALRATQTCFSLYGLISRLVATNTHLWIWSSLTCIWKWKAPRSWSNFQRAPHGTLGFNRSVTVQRDLMETYQWSSAYAVEVIEEAFGVVNCGA